jgi:hypothetical protein
MQMEGHIALEIFIVLSVKLLFINSLIYQK